MKVDKEGAAGLGDGRPSEDTFKIQEETFITQVARRVL